MKYYSCSAARPLFYGALIQTKNLSRSEDRADAPRDSASSGTFKRQTDGGSSGEKRLRTNVTKSCDREACRSGTLVGGIDWLSLK